MRNLVDPLQISDKKLFTISVPKIIDTALFQFVQIGSVFLTMSMYFVGIENDDSFGT